MKRTKRQNTINIFVYSLLYSLQLSERGNGTFWSIITSRSFQKESFGFYLWDFLLLSRYILLSALWWCSQFTATGEPFPSHARENRDRRFGTCVGPCSEPAWLLRKPRFGQLWWLIPSHDSRYSLPLQPLAVLDQPHLLWGTPVHPVACRFLRRGKAGGGGDKLPWLSPLFPLKSLSAAFQCCRGN